MMKTYVKVMAVVLVGLGFLYITNNQAGGSDAQAKWGQLSKLLTKEIDSHAEASDGVKAFTKSILMPLCTNPVFVKEVAAQNAKNISLDDIKAIDEEWKNAEDELPVHQEKLGNACGRETQKIVEMLPMIREMFVMDNQGANVGQNALTSDYWQGDEAKWQNSYKDGQGGVDIGEVEFDKSANLELQQISLPIIDNNAQVIGAVCFGIDKPFAEKLGSVGQGISTSGAASDEVKNFVQARLLPLCTNSVFIKETQAQNAKGVSLDEIKKIDEEWKNAEDELPIHSEKMGNACAKEIINCVKANPAIIEAFVMDNQGANVGQNALTSDYWQGDEAKWQNSYKDGQGGADVGEVEFDKSANVQLQQISLPIIDGKGQVIGAVCYGINTDKVKSVQTASDKTGVWAF
ncbi:MAG: hypothetical protein JW860_11125 [Sedimentisphaerales bacterium]|nr:hypothetical protein [Sedimentisphaerales bacterium]